MFPSVSLDGMPHSGKHSDLSGYAAQLDEKQARLKDIRFIRRRLYRDILRRINLLSNKRERMVLMLYYIKENSWNSVASAMNCTYYSVKGLSARAVRHFRL